MSKDYIQHYGIDGMKKGIRRWQYPDGRFNEEGKIRYFGKSGERSRLESKKKYVGDLMMNYITPKGVRQWIPTLLFTPGMIGVAGLTIGSSIMFGKKKVSDVIQKGNMIADDILKEYGNKTMDEAMNDINFKALQEKKLPKDQRIRYADTIVNI